MFFYKIDYELDEALFVFAAQDFAALAFLAVEFGYVFVVFEVVKQVQIIDWADVWVSA